MEKTTDYRNRIKALEYIDSRELMSHPGNWRDCGLSQVDALGQMSYNTDKRNAEAIHEYPPAWRLVRASHMSIVPLAPVACHRSFIMSRDGIGAVYVIRNTVNGKVYVGSSANVKERFRTHRKQLRGNRHPNAHLQSAWQAYGEPSFIFEIVENVSDYSTLIQREQAWMDSLGSTIPATGYNMRPFADSSRGKKATPEQRAKLSAARKGNQYSLGTKQSQETIDKRRAKLIGKRWTLSQETKQTPKYLAGRASASEKMSGRKQDWHTSVSQETRNKIADSVKQARAATLKVYDGFIDPHGNAVGPIRGLEDFCKKYGMTRSLMEKGYTGERRGHNGWTAKRD